MAPTKTISAKQDFSCQSLYLKNDLDLLILAMFKSVSKFISVMKENLRLYKDRL